MKTKTIIATLTILMLLANIGFVAVVQAGQPLVDETTYYYGTIGMPDVVDPVSCYDTASGELIGNVYDNLIDFAVDYSLPPAQQGQHTQFAPGLATTLPTRQDIVLIIQNETFVPIPDPTCSFWTDGTHLFHINNWVDNNPDDMLGPFDVVYVEQVTHITEPYDPWTWIPCTKYTYQVKNRWDVGLQVFLNLTRHEYTFPIRQHVKIHDWRDRSGTWHIGEELTANDIVYSLQRNLVQDPDAGPDWLHFKPLFDQMNQGYWRAKGLPGLIELGKLLMCAIRTDGTNVYISMGIDFPETGWFQSLSSGWSCIVPKAFAVDHLCWPGTIFNASNYPVFEYYRQWEDSYYGPLDMEPATMSPIDPTPYAGHPYDPAPTARGTGPYTLTYWNLVTNEYRLDKFANYWGGWDTSGADARAHGIPYHVDTAIVTKVAEWSTRKMMFLAGDFDQIDVPRAYMFDLLEPTPPYDPLPGVVCVKDLPSVSSQSCHYIFNISSTSPYMPKIGVVNTPLFFSDIHARRAFSWSINFTKYLEEAWFGEAVQVPSWHINGLFPDYRDYSLTGFHINLTEVENELKLAMFGGVSLWDSGFSLKLGYNEGNDQRRISCEMMEQAIESLNAIRPGPDFVLDVIELPWADYLLAYRSHWLPFLIIGWLSDFTDADNWARPYMHTWGDFAYLQGYSNVHVDNLIDLAIKTPDGPERRAMYYELQQIYLDDCVSLMMVQALGRNWRRNWSQGWLYNQLHSGIEFYERWKGFLEDFNRDIVVDLLDLVKLANLFGAQKGDPNSPPDPKYDPLYDLNKDDFIDLLDLVKCANMFGAGVP